MRRHRIVMFVVSIWFTISTTFAMASEVGLFYSSDLPQVEFAGNEIRAALKSRGDVSASGDLLQLPQSIQRIRIAIAAHGKESHQIVSRGAPKPASAGRSKPASVLTLPIPHPFHSSQLLLELSAVGHFC